jgi:isocitrate/isopropylmalate dehydrogenase
MSPVPRPKDFDVVLTENMFGDILSDQAGGLIGSLGCWLRRASRVRLACTRRSTGQRRTLR